VKGAHGCEKDFGIYIAEITCNELHTSVHLFQVLRLTIDHINYKEVIINARAKNKLGH